MHRSQQRATCWSEGGLTIRDMLWDDTSRVTVWTMSTLRQQFTLCTVYSITVLVHMYTIHYGRDKAEHANLKMYRVSLKGFEDSLQYKFFLFVYVSIPIYMTIICMVLYEKLVIHFCCRLTDKSAPFYISELLV